MAKDPRKPLQNNKYRLPSNVGSDKSLLTTVGKHLDPDLNIGIYAKAGSEKPDFVVTGYGNKDEDVAAYRAAADPLDWIAGFASRTGRLKGKKAEAYAQLVEHPAFKGKTPEQQRATIEKIQALTNQSFGLRMDGANQFVLELAKQDPAAAAELLGRMGVNLPIKPEVNDWWSATEPFLKDVPVLQSINRGTGIAAAASGATAGSIAMANMLMQQGQQQQDSNAYAAAVQQMNAY